MGKSSAIIFHTVTQSAIISEIGFKMTKILLGAPRYLRKEQILEVN